MSETAQDTVISTPELLEQTLAQLPMRDLLVTAPLVCKTWQAVTLSPTLQRALFFEPDLSVSEHVQNPLLVEAFPPFFAFLQNQPHSAWPGHIDSIEGMPWSKAPDAFKRKEASWRRMLITQPPAQSITINQTSSGQVGKSERRGMLKDLSLRMGDLYDLVVPFIDDDVTDFHIRWHNNIELEGDLMLSVNSSFGCMDDLQRTLDKRFLSDGAKAIEVNFGEWGTTPWY